MRLEGNSSQQSQTLERDSPASRVSKLLETVSIRDVLLEHAGRREKVVVVPNMGNAGDSLSNHAVYSMLRRQSIGFSVIEPGRIQASLGTTYLIVANGGLHGHENELDRCVAQLSHQRARIILLGTTITARGELLRCLPADAVVAAREPVTFQLVRLIRPDIRCILSEDVTMALVTGDADLPQGFDCLRAWYLFRARLKAAKLGCPLDFVTSPKRYQPSHNGTPLFSALRTDDERINDSPKDITNVDLSVVVCASDQTPEHAEACAAVFLDILAAKKFVRTDRLHVAIGCGLTGVSCEFFPNNYFKCAAVYWHSLRHRYPAVRWCGPLEAGTR